MNPLLIFLLAILSPLLLSMALFGPIYAGVTGACYVIYDKGATTHPLMGKLEDVFYIASVYQNLFDNWHMDKADMVGYTLPLLMFPLVGFVIAIWLTGWLARKLQHIFQMGVSH